MVDHSCQMSSSILLTAGLKSSNSVAHICQDKQRISLDIVMNGHQSSRPLCISFSFIKKPTAQDLVFVLHSEYCGRNGLGGVKVYKLCELQSLYVDQTKPLGILIKFAIQTLFLKMGNQVPDGPLTPVKKKKS